MSANPPLPQRLWLGGLADHDGHSLIMVVAADHQADAEAAMRRAWADHFGLPADASFVAFGAKELPLRQGLPGETITVWAAPGD